MDNRSTYTQIFFSEYVLKYYMVHGWLNLTMGGHRYRGPTEISTEFLLYKRLAFLILTLFKGQLFLFSELILKILIPSPCAGLILLLRFHPIVFISWSDSLGAMLGWHEPLTG